MSAKHHLHVAHPLPPTLTPNDVIAALHDHTTALTLQALTCGHERAPSTHPETLKDTYWFPPDQYPITTYHVTECITLLPGIGEWGKKYITFPSCFQDSRQGIKTRADAPGGVTVRAEFRIVAGGAIGSEIGGEGMGVGDAEWVLVEDVEVSCGWWLMPFVKGKMEQAHQDVCRKIVERVVEKNKGHGGAQNGLGIGVNEGQDLHTGYAPGTTEQYGMPSRVSYGQTFHDAQGPVEVDATESQRAEMSSAPLPDKITYR
jgi:hypothetical protein